MRKQTKLDVGLEQFRQHIAKVVSATIPCDYCGKVAPLDEALSKWQVRYVYQELEDEEGPIRIDCPACQAAETAAENAALSYAEGGGASEAANDWWAERVHGGS